MPALGRPLLSGKPGAPLRRRLGLEPLPRAVISGVLGELQSLLGPWGQSLLSSCHPRHPRLRAGPQRETEARESPSPVWGSFRPLQRQQIFNPRGWGLWKGHKQGGTHVKGQGHPAQSPISPCSWCHHQCPNMLWEGEGDMGHGRRTQGKDIAARTTGLGDTLGPLHPPASALRVPWQWLSGDSAALEGSLVPPH